MESNKNFIRKNMEEELMKKIVEQQEKIDAVYISVEKLRKYFMWTLIVTGVTFLLPLVIIIVVLPFIFSAFSGLYR